MDDDIIRVRDQYYILSTSSLTDDRVRVLKEGDTFAVYDRRGDIDPVGKQPTGSITTRRDFSPNGCYAWAENALCCSALPSETTMRCSP